MAFLGWKYTLIRYIFGKGGKKRVGGIWVIGQAIKWVIG